MADNATNIFETGILGLIFHGTSIAGIADNDQSSPLTSLSIQLHTASPTDTGDLTANEATYTGYARVGVPRVTSSWTIAGSSSATATISPSTNITFGQCTTGNEVITHWSIGNSTVAASTGTMFMYGAVTPNITVSAGVTPRLTTASQIVII